MGPWALFQELVRILILACNIISAKNQFVDGYFYYICTSEIIIFCECWLFLFHLAKCLICLIGNWWFKISLFIFSISSHNMVEVTNWEMLQVNVNGCDWPICGMWIFGAPRKINGECFHLFGEWSNLMPSCNSL